MGEFKIAFANNEELIIKIFEMIINNNQEIKLYKDKIINMKYLKLMLETKLSLITLIWSIIHKNNKNMQLIKKLQCPSLQPLTQRIVNLNKRIKWKKDQNHTKILLNSLLDRCKFVNKLLCGMGA